MNGLHRTGQEYTGKHRRDNTLPSPWASRAESYGRPGLPDGRPAPGAVPMSSAGPESGFWPEPEPWADAG